MEPFGMIWEGKESDCAHMCTHVHARMHTSVQVRGCKWVQMSGRIQWNTKVEFWGVVKKSDFDGLVKVKSAKCKTRFPKVVKSDVHSLSGSERSRNFEK